MTEAERYLLLVWQVERRDILVLASPVAHKDLPAPLWNEIMSAFNMQWHNASPTDAFISLLKSLVPLSSLFFKPNENERRSFWGLFSLD